MVSLVLLALLAPAVLGHPQYSPPASGGPAPVHDVCGPGFGCVLWITCKNGVIDTTGAGNFDLRLGPNKTPPADLGYTDCGPDGLVCCKEPGHAGGPQVPHSSGGVPVGGGGQVGGINTHTGGSQVVGGPPYPACLPGLQCVTEVECNLYTGFLGASVPAYDGQPKIDYKHCTTEYIDVGVCCQAGPVVGGGQVGGGVVAGGSGNVGGGAVVSGGGGYVDGSVGGGGIVSGGHVGGGGVVGGGVVAGGGQVGVGGGGYVEASGGGVSGLPADYVDPCSQFDECVPVNICNQGVIDTSGAGLFDLRGKFEYTTCIKLSDPATKAVCCRKPEFPVPLKACLGAETCTPFEYCKDGFIYPDIVGPTTYTTGSECYLNPGFAAFTGVCCQTGPAPVTQCQDYDVCTPYEYCNHDGYIIADPLGPLSYTSGTKCYQNPGVNTVDLGVCCKPAPVSVIHTCPIDSVCIPPSYCFGEGMQDQDTFLPFVPEGNWAQCTLSSTDGEKGVCCRNPPPPVEVKQQCGISHYGSKDDSIYTRIHAKPLDKVEADFGEFPWQAIIFFSNYTFKCSASLISDQYLLTAAHCVNTYYPQDIRIRLGEWQVNTFLEPLPYQDVDVDSIIIHPEYTKNSHWNNIAIIKLKYPVTLEYNVNNICLNFGRVDFAPGTYCWVSGWGKDSFTGTYQHIQKKIDVPLVDHYTCQELLRKTRLTEYFRLHNSYTCAGGEAGKDACVGDGGGPLICFDNAQKRYIQVGITAWGISCGVENVPGVYTDVTQFLPWITQVTGIDLYHGSYA